MGNQRDEVLRSAVRAFLLDPANRGKSDRLVAREVPCHRSIVRQVRARLHSQRKLRLPSGYKVAAGIRGGYVVDDRGRAVREIDWIISQARQRSDPAARLLARLILDFRTRGR